MAKQKETQAEEITTAEAAQILGVHPNHILNLIKDGTLEGRKVTNRLWLVKRSSLGNFEHKRKPKHKE